MTDLSGRLVNVFELCSLLFLSIHSYNFVQAREMDKRKEGKPGEARAALRRSVRENGCVSDLMLAVYIVYFLIY